MTNKNKKPSRKTGDVHSLPPTNCSAHYDSVWKKVPMPVDYTCGCGLYVHPSRVNPEAIHCKDCRYNSPNV